MSGDMEKRERLYYDLGIWSCLLCGLHYACNFLQPDKGSVFIEDFLYIFQT